MARKLPDHHGLSASEARFAAQRLAFGPLVFHATLALRDLGVLEALMHAEDGGATLQELTGRLDLSRYAITVLLEAGLGANLVSLEDERYQLTKVGYFVLHDEMTRVNLNFVRDICYHGAAALMESLEHQQPRGLRHLGPWNTIYEGISSLPEPARTSWFEFDHYYSSSAFPDAYPLVFADGVKRLLDVGGNTGKWAVFCAERRAELRVTVVDDAPQVHQALTRARKAGVESRVSGHVLDLLAHEQPFPRGFDGVWMSQLLSCFSEQDITALLRRAANALDENGRLYILETFWDRQKYAGAAYNLQQTSLYFTAIANGVSRIYDYASIARCIEAAGLRVDDVFDGLGVSHTLLSCSVRPDHR